MSTAEALIREQVWRELRGEDNGHIDVAARTENGIGEVHLSGET